MLYSSRNIVLKPVGTGNYVVCYNDRLLFHIVISGLLFVCFSSVFICLLVSSLFVMNEYGNIIGLTHWGRLTHKYISRLNIIDSDNGLSPGRRQAIIWTNAGLLLIGPLGTNFSEILIKIQNFSFMKMHLKISSAKRRPFCPGEDKLMPVPLHLF